MRRRHLVGMVVGVLVTAGALAALSGAASATSPTRSHSQGPLHLMKPLSGSLHSAKGGKHGPPGGGGSGSNNLTYHGGAVETAPAVYLVFWGSQWGSQDQQGNFSNDPYGEAQILENFLGGVGSSPWLNSVTQYCQNTNSTTSCSGNYTPAGNQAGILKGVWYDNTAAPARPKQSDLAGEAVAAAQYFGTTNNQTAQFIIATAHGDNPSGFGHQYCAWHSSTGNIAYTNLPYITDAGASCGANFVSAYADGITIVEGHELAETITDQYPSSGWLDANGEENGDKCAWNSATNDVSFGSNSYAVQPLWSNAANNGKGGCVMSYP